MHAITILPWRNESELAFVRDCFYPDHIPTTPPDLYTTVVVAAAAAADSATDRATNHEPTRLSRYRDGFQRVAVWSFKSPRNVPRAVTATANLIDAKFHDERWYRAASPGSCISQNAVRSLYGMAFQKFVNSFVDRDVVRSSTRSGVMGLAGTAEVADSTDDDDDDDEWQDEMLLAPQTRGAGESSMYAYAVTVGMPAHFVDLRHRCVHGELPELHELREGTEQALAWLWTRWWKANSRGDPERFRREMEEWRAGDDGGLARLVVHQR